MGARWGRLPDPRAGLRAPLLYKHGQLLAQLDWAFDLPGPLAGDGQPGGPHAQTPGLPTLRLAGRGPDLWPPRTPRGRAQLGLPLYLDPGRVVYALCAESPGLHRRDGRLYRASGFTQLCRRASG